MKISRYEKIKQLNEQINFFKQEKEKAISSGNKTLAFKYDSLIRKERINIERLDSHKKNNTRVYILLIVISAFVFSFFVFDYVKTGFIVGNITSNNTILIPNAQIGGNITLHLKPGDFIGNNITINVSITNTSGGITNTLSRALMTLPSFFNNASEWHCKNDSSPSSNTFVDVDNVRNFEGGSGIGFGYNGSAGCTNIFQVNITSFIPSLNVPLYISGQSFNLSVNITYNLSGQGQEQVLYFSKLLFINRPPNISSVNIIPASASTHDSIFADITGLGDPDDMGSVEANNVSYNWYVNNKSLTLLYLPFTNYIYSHDGNTMFDFSGHNIKNTFIQGATYTNDNCTIGGCYRTDVNPAFGIEGGSVRPDHFSMRNFTVLFWYNPSSTPPIASAASTRDYVLRFFDLDYGNNDNNDELFSIGFTNLSVVDAGNLTVYINYANESFGNYSQTFASNNSNFSVKRFIAVTREVSVGKNNVSVFFDVDYVASLSADGGSFGGAILSTNGEARQIGKMIGTLDELMIFNRTLSIEQINSFYNNGVGNYSKIVKNEIRANEIWNVSVVPIDNLGLNGSMIISNSVAPVTKPSLINPRGSKVIINPRFNMSFNFSTLGAVGLKNATVYGNWSNLIFKTNNSNISSLVSSSIFSIDVKGIGNGTWSWNVEICNSDHNCQFNNSNLTFIANNAPNISSVSILPSSPTVSSDLLANITGLTDYDGDIVEVNNLSYNWYVNHSSLTLLNLPFNDIIYGSDDNFNNMTNRTIFDYSGNNLYTELRGVAGAVTGANAKFPNYTTSNCTIGGCYK
ncbi:MAG: hypothetical protein AABW52_03500, partial [Nanoarchaeota archaeon]